MPTPSSTGSKEIAQIGAAIGREISHELLAAIANRPDAQLRDALEQLVSSGLILRRGSPQRATFIFKHALVQDAAYSTLLRRRRQELHAHIATALEERFAIDQQQEASAGEHAALLAHHWLRAEDGEKALRYVLRAAEQAGKIYACPEAINHYWQALSLLEQTPQAAAQTRAHTDTILSLVRLPGWVRDEAGKARMLRHLDQALTDAAVTNEIATMARFEAIKGELCEDEALLIGAVERAEDSRNLLAEAFAAIRYGNYLGQRGRFGEALSHAARAIEIVGAQRELVGQGIMMANQGRCYHARAGALEEGLEYARRARQLGDVLGDARLRASRGMEAEAYLYAGDWSRAISAAEEALPLAWEIGDWGASCGPPVGRP